MSGPLAPDVIEAVRARWAGERLAELVQSDGVALRRRGREWWGLCPFHAERTASFKVDAKGFFKCWGCGEAGPDAIAWTMARWSLPFRDAVLRLADAAGIAGPRFGAAAAPRPPSAEEVERRRIERDAAERERLRNLERARRIWHSGTALAGTLAERYLHDRGLSPPLAGAWPPTLRFVARLTHAAPLEDGEEPDLAHYGGGARLLTDEDGHRVVLSDWPCLVGAVSGPDRTLLGVWRIWIWERPDGRVGKAPVRAAKQGLGAASGGAVRLTPPAPELAVTEGIETGLAVAQALRARVAAGEVAVWAARSTGQLVPLEVPREMNPASAGAGSGDGANVVRVRAVTIMADNDANRAGQRAAETLARRLRAEGLEARIAVPPRAGEDWLDVLNAKGEGACPKVA